MKRKLSSPEPAAAEVKEDEQSDTSSVEVKKPKTKEEDKSTLKVKKTKTEEEVKSTLDVKKTKTEEEEVKSALMVKKRKTEVEDKSTPKVKKPKTEDENKSTPKVNKPKTEEEDKSTPKVKKPKTEQAEEEDESTPKVKKPKTEEEDKSTPKGESSSKTPRKRKRMLYAQLVKQMEFYFSDANLSKSAFMTNLAGEGGGSWIDLEVFLKFNKLTEMMEAGTGRVLLDDLWKALSTVSTGNYYIFLHAVVL